MKLPIAFVQELTATEEKTRDLILTLPLFDAFKTDELDVLARHIRDQSADMLVMGAYGHSRLRQFLLGSTTSALLASSQSPLLILR